MSIKDKQTYFARSEQGEIVSIDDVVRGKKCKCVCTNCGASLVARKGDKNIHHFAHHSDAKCEGAYETSLHLGIKYRLLHQTQITVPAGIHSGKTHTFKILEASEEVFEASTGLKPDITLLLENGERLFVEVYVTHASTAEKTLSFKKQGLNLLELDFSHRPDESELDDEFQNVVNRAYRTKWLSISLHGEIAKIIQQNERDTNAKLINDNKNLSEALENKKSALARTEVELKTLTDDCVSVRSELEIYKANFDQEKIRTEKRIREALPQLYEEHKDISEKISNLRLYFVDYESNERVKIDSRMQSRESEIRDELRIKIENELINQETQQTARLEALQSHLREVTREIEDANIKRKELDSINAEIDRKRAFFKDVEAKYAEIAPLKAQCAHATVQLTRLFKELRPITRKCGIPWPFKDTLIEELEGAKRLGQPSEKKN